MKHRAALWLWMAIAISLPACAKSTSNTSSSNAGTGQKPRLAMVTDVGGLGDKSFNDSANAGLKRAETQLGVQVQVLQSKSAADYQPNLTVLANEKYDEILAIGFLMNKDLAQVAKTIPARHFAIIDAVVDAPNVVSVTFREQDGSFLAGALAALVSKTKRIAFLGGLDIPLLRKFEAGFTAGARQIDPTVKVAVKYAGSFEDVAAGKELAGVLFGDRADVIFVAAGKTGLGAIDEVRSREHVYVIGVDANQDDLAKGKVLTSMVKRVDNAVFKLAQAVVAGKPPTGHIEFGLKDDGVGLTDFAFTKEAIGSANIAKVAALKAAIVAGTIRPPQTREELAAFKPVNL